LKAFEQFQFNSLQIAARGMVTAFIIYALQLPKDYKWFQIGNFKVRSRRFQHIPEEPYLKSWLHSRLFRKAHPI